MPLRMEVGLGSGDFVFDGDPAPLPKKGVEPPFSAHVYCGHDRPSQLLLSSCFCDQTAAQIQVPIGTEVGLGPSA